MELCFGKRLESVSIQGAYHDMTWHFNTLKGFTKSGSVALSGAYQNQDQQSLEVVFQEWPLMDGDWLQQRLPDAILPLRGVLTGRLNLKNRDISGRAKLVDGNIWGQYFDTLFVEGEYGNGEIRFEDAAVFYNSSQLLASGEWVSTQNFRVNLKPGSSILVDDFAFLTAQFGDASGYLKVEGFFDKKEDRVTSDVSLALTRFSVNGVGLDQLEGRRYENGGLIVNNMSVQRGANSLSLEVPFRVGYGNVPRAGKLEL